MDSGMEEHGVTSALVATWADSLDIMQERIGPRFARSEHRQRVRAYISTLNPVAMLVTNLGSIGPSVHK